MSSRANEPSAVPTFRADEATGTRLKVTVFAPPSQVSPCVLARRQLQAGLAEEALELLENELLAGGESAELQFWTGRAAFAAGDFVRAERALSRATVLSPDDAEARRWLARALLRRGNPLAAMRVWRRAARSTMPPKVVSDGALFPQPFAEEEPVEDDDADCDEPPTTQWVPEVRRSSAELVLPDLRREE